MFKMNLNLWINEEEQLLMILLFRERKWENGYQGLIEKAEYDPNRVPDND